jgi:hypothetical protein
MPFQDPKLLKTYYASMRPFRAQQKHLLVRDAVGRGEGGGGRGRRSRRHYQKQKCAGNALEKREVIYHLLEA